MNKEVLDQLMKGYKIKSYFQLSKEICMPYTTLLDLVNGRGERVTNIKLIADFFNVPLHLLIDETKFFYILDDHNNLIEIPETNLYINNWFY